MSIPKLNLKQMYSYADYLNWDEGERWEIIDGSPYMHATPSRMHQEISGELFRQISNHLLGKTCKVYSAPFCVRLDEEKSDYKIRNVFEPDITVVCDKSKLDDKGCKGTPDMIIEILSPSTGKNDKILKFNKYEKAGVKEYWIAEPDTKILNVFILQDDGTYGKLKVYSDEDKVNVSLFPDLEIDLNLVFNGAAEEVPENAEAEDKEDKREDEE